MVDHLDNQPVSLPCNNYRPWKLPVYCDYALVMAQSCNILQFDLKIFPHKVRYYQNHHLPILMDRDLCGTCNA